MPRRRMMEEKKMKSCLRCKKEFEATADNFFRRSAAKDGLEPYCKQCKNKMLNRSRGAIKTQKIPRKQNTRKPIKSTKSPLTTATPREILAALRKGVAREIIQMIEEKFGRE
jgi:excinuclease UvrABC ATPase subunit